MDTAFRSLLIAMMIAAILPRAAGAQAAPYQGIYVLIDPYNAKSIHQLEQAAQTPCGQIQSAVTSPFCGATNGVLLRINWCNFQLYHAIGPDGSAIPSCHYVVGYSHGPNSPGVQVNSNDLVSPCRNGWDTCSGKRVSVLSRSLTAIAQIDQLRAQVGLPPLNLSVGLAAGAQTPQAVLDSVGTVDVPHTNSATGDAGKVQCFRLPDVWQKAYLTAYESAFDQLMGYLLAEFPQGANIQIVKASGIAANDLEIEMPGRSTPLAAPADPGPAGPGGLLSCPAGSAAQTWLDAYNADANGTETFSQAVETSFGTLIGHEWGTLLNDGISAELSIPTADSLALTQVDCGVTGGNPCAVTPNTGNWSVYYFELYTTDLFNGGLAWSAAQTAYGAIRSDGFALPPQLLAVNWTSLSVTPITPVQQIGCILNNVLPANAPVERLDGQKVQILGAGTAIGWQTAVGSGSLCQKGLYSLVMNNGLINGGQFFEVQTDAAFTDLASCAAPLSLALSQVLLATPPGSCLF